MKLTKTHSTFYVLLIVSFLSFLIAIFIGFRIINRVEDKPRPHPRQTNVSLIQTWMTLPYLSKTYGVPISVFEDRLQIDPKYENQSIEYIAQKKGVDKNLFLAQVQHVIITFGRRP